MNEDTLSKPFDVVVIGGGAAGICAAVQAGRADARTLLVEKNGILGGTVTIGGVAFPGLFHARDRQVIAGIGWELVRRTVDEVGGSLPDFTEDYGEQQWRHQIRIDPAVFAALADEAVLDAGVVLLLHTMLADAEQTDDGWIPRLCCKEGPRPVTAKVLIDCTGDANAAAIAGFAVRRGERLQAATIMARTGGYDVDALDFPALEAAWRGAVERGDVLASDLPGCESFLCARGMNRTHVPGVDATTSAARTEAELAGRRCLMRLFHFFRDQSGLADFHYEWIAPECGIRETSCIVGETEITGPDYFAGRRYEDAVCYSFYPIDIHTPDGLGLDKRTLPRGVVPTIPRGAMIPTGSRRLLAAGRCICGDQEAHSAFRVQATCMATGQAAGAMAALAAADGTDVRDLSMSDIHALLGEHGAIIPVDFR